MSILTIVAIASVHWPDDFMGVADLLMGYAITDRGHGNYKLPLIFLVMLLPLVLRGAGRFSLDALISHLSRNEVIPQPNADGYAWGFLAIALGLPMAMLLPTAGFSIAAAGAALVVATRMLRP